MADHHRKSTRRRSSVARRRGSGLAATAVSAAGLSTAVVTGATAAVAPHVQLMALITPSNSTAQIFAGSTYYGTDYTNPPTFGPQQVVPFFRGPDGIADAISQADGQPIVILASGWGAGQTGTALGQLKAGKDPALNDITLVILDNNSNRAGGGFWTTYAPFAPLLFTSAAPTPNNTGVPILDVGYQYNINSDAPTDPLNVASDANSLLAYIYDYGAQSTTVIPTTDMEGKPLEPGIHYVVENGVVVDQYEAPGTADNPNTSTIFVTVKSENLPLTRPLRLLPGGDIVADAIDPTVTQIVDAGYQHGKSIPTDPGVPQPMTPGSSIGNLGGVPGTVQVGLAKGAQTAQKDLSSPGNLATKPLSEVTKLPVRSGSGLPSLPTPKLKTTKLSNTGGNLFVPGSKKHGSTASSGGAKPVKAFSDKVNDTVSKVHDTVSKATGGLSGGP